MTTLPEEALQRQLRGKDRLKIWMASEKTELATKINDLRKKAFKSNDADDREAYFQALSSAFQLGDLVVTDALSFLPVQGAGVSADARQALDRFSFAAQQWGWQADQGSNDAIINDTKAEFDASYAALERILSTLEPSAARELALEEIIALCKDYAEDSQPDSEYRLACNDIIEALQERRALSSPDHADAGKVEGDGWPTGEYEVDYEVICNGEWVAGSTDLNDAKHYAAVYSQDGKIEIVEARTYRRPIPSAPASECAE